MTIPTIYRGTPSQILSNSDFFDFAQGKGIKVLKAAAIAESGAALVGNDSLSGAIYILTGSDIYSSPAYTARSNIVNNTPTAPNISCKFDLTFNNPLIVDGTCIVTVPIGFRGAGAGGETITTFASCSLVIIPSSGNSQVLGTASGAIISTTAGSSSVPAAYLQNLNFDVTRKKIKKGDTMRLYTEIWATSSSNNTTFMLGHDPKDRTLSTSVWDAGTTRSMELSIPIVIQ